MSYRHLKAHYDGNAIVLDDPATLPAGMELVVLVPEAGETFEEWREDWLRFSAEGLARAYGDDEPAYTEADCIR
jgi:hypothetical protein